MRVLTRVARGRWLAIATAALLVAASAAEARPGRSGGLGGGIGSRGARSFDAPAPTATAPRPAAPLARTASPAAGPMATQPSFANRGMFGGGFMSGLMGGLLGAGLFGLLFGGGLMGGFGGGASILGFLLQIGLIVALVMLARRWFARRQQPAYAGAHARTAGPMEGLGTAGWQDRAGGTTSRGTPLTLADGDFDLFEQLLLRVQAAYDSEDRAALRAVTTNGMARLLEAEIDDNAKRGLVNRLSDVRLLQGDLAEAWRDPDGGEYATVAMRFGLLDWTIERTTGQVVEGDPSKPTEAVELWTFRRDRGGAPWRLSAIQQA